MATQSPSIIEVSHLSGETKTVYSRFSGHFSKIFANRDAERNEQAKDIALAYYDLVTDFYEYGYGTSFHFVPILSDKTLPECISEYQIGIGRDLHAKPGMKLLVSLDTSNPILVNASVALHIVVFLLLSPLYLGYRLWSWRSSSSNC